MQNESEFTFTDIEKLRNDDIDAFGRLYKSYFEQLVRFSCNYLNELESAENVVQDVFCNVWKNRKRLDSRKNIKSYLYQAVRNQSLKYIRHQKIRREYISNNIFINVDSEPSDSLVKYKELETAVNKAIRKLPKKCYTVFTMNRFNNLSYKEIADILGISVKAVEKQMTRAFKILKKQLHTFLSLLTF
jgi:RNA polymerase sigma-70 factor (ECF subfamily)